MPSVPPDLQMAPLMGPFPCSPVRSKHRSTLNFSPLAKDTAQLSPRKRFSRFKFNPPSYTFWTFLSKFPTTTLQILHRGCANAFWDVRVVGTGFPHTVRQAVRCRSPGARFTSWSLRIYAVMMIFLNVFCTMKERKKLSFS